jgi:hypothetical protein
MAIPSRTNTLANQRFDTYIVISIPNRNSMAVGVSHVISMLLVWYCAILRPDASGRISGIMILDS